MGQEENKEVAPVKLSIGATVSLVIGLAVVVFIIIITFRSCSIEKKTQITEIPTESTSSISMVKDTSETTSNMGSAPIESTEISGFTESTVSPLPEVSTVPETTISTTEQFTSNNKDAIEKVSDPVLSKELKTYGMVTSKSVYKKGSSYVYGVSISMVINEQTVTTEYFCPRKTYDSLNPGNSLDITYSMGDIGGISIYSISLS